MVSDHGVDETDEEVSSYQTTADYNQVEVDMNSGETHCVVYVLRHPNRNWCYASRVVDVDEDGVPTSEELILRAENIESIRSDHISWAKPSGDATQVKKWVHHTVQFQYVSTDNVWKAWLSDDKIQRFQGETATAAQSD